MFDDILSSSRGPGVIGTFLGVFVLAAFCGLGLMVFNTEGQGPSADAALAEQKDRIKELNEKITDTTVMLNQYQGYQARMADLSLQAKLLDMRNSRVSDLNSKSASLSKELDEIGQGFESYKNLYRRNERELARGEIHDLSDIKGERFKEAKILRINPIEMRVSISSGPKGIKYEDLPDDLQDRFQFHPDEADAYREALGMAEVQRKKNAAKWDKEKQALKAATRASERVNEISQKRRQISSKTAYVKKKFASAAKWQTKAAQYEAKARAARARGGISIDGGNARKARATSKRLRRAAEKGQREISKLRAEIVDLQRKLRK